MGFDDIKNIIYSLSLLGAIIAAPFLISKYYYDVHLVRRTRLRDEFKFADDFLGKIASDNEMHPYAKERGYQAIAGTSLLSGSEIAYLLSLYTTEYQRENLMDQRPDMAIRNYLNGKEYLKFDHGNGISRIDFRQRYTSKWFRAFVKYFFFLLYFSFAIGIVAILIMSDLVLKKIQLKWSDVVAFSFFFGAGLWFSLNKAGGIHLAERIVENQEKKIINSESKGNPKLTRKVFNHRKKCPCK